MSGHGAGWGALATVLAALAFAEAARIERGHAHIPGELWLFSRRNAVLGFVPFAGTGAWTLGRAVLALYATSSFFFVQNWHHRIVAD
jgi:hypothetical protein